MALRLLRKAGIPLAIAAVSIVLTAATYLAPLTSATFANRLGDLRAHADALSNPASFGFRNAPDWEIPNDRLALIQIDEATLAPASGLPAFPFPRAVYGTLLKRLGAAGAKSVAFDIVFESPSADPSQDAAFAAGGKTVPAVIGYTIATTTAGIAFAKIPPARLRSTMHIGFTSADYPGGVLIDYPLQISPVRDVPGGAATSLAFAAVEAYGAHADPASIPKLNGAPLILPFNALGTIDTTHHAQAYAARFAGAGISFADALHEPLSDLRAFAKDRIVLIGATAQAMGDYAPSFSGRVPGMYFHARMIDQLLRGTYITPAPDWLNLSLLVLLPLALVAFVLRLRPAIAAPVAALAIAAYVETAFAVFVYRLYWLDVLHVAAAMLLTALGAIAYRAVVEAAERRAVTAAFGLHVSPSVVAEILKRDGSANALAGKRAKVTIFYSDVRGFTSMSETLPPEAVYEQLNEYYEAMCEVIFKYGGYIDKFIGDCIMAVFSAPNPAPDDAVKAVRAALEQQALIDLMSRRWREQGKPPLTVGMGLNTGYVVMGNLGSQKRMNYTVIGDDVNVAARLYNLAKGGQILISESTYEEVKAYFEVRELEPVSVKGKSAPLRTYSVLGYSSNSIPSSATEISPE